MSELQRTLLRAFVSWASDHQQRLLDCSSPYVTTLQVGRATNNRAITFKVEKFKVETTGWIGDELEQGGWLTFWANGCADAEWAESVDSNSEMFAPSYQEHWDDLSQHDFSAAFVRFTTKFERF